MTKGWVVKLLAASRSCSSGDPKDGVWVTYVPTLGDLSTYGETREEALDQTREAIIGYLEAAAKEGLPVPPADAETEVVELEVGTS